MIGASALFWGLQFAFLNPALALLLATVFHASAGEIGWALAIYNTGGFIASLLLPAYADRARDYVRPMLACGMLTLGLAGVLAIDLVSAQASWVVRVDENRHGGGVPYGQFPVVERADGRPVVVFTTGANGVWGLGAG